ncbi:DUF2092 domain-containing protein [Pseudomonas abietaniphila]|jgi:hypothetical protein
MNDGRSSRFKSCLVVGLLSLLSGVGQIRAADQPAPQVAEKDPRALKILQDMGVYLRGLKNVHLTTNSDTDQVLENGQVVQFSYHTELIATPPDKLRISVVDGPYRKTLFYNGKRFALFDQGQRYYASGDAPATIDALLDDMNERYGIVLPLADLFRWNANTADEVGISSALYINDQEIDGQLCAHYAYRQPDVDWELWVHLGPRPMPCQLVIVRQDSEGLPRHSVRYHWIPEKPAPTSAFEFVPPAGAHAVPLKEIAPPPREVQP